MKILNARAVWFGELVKQVNSIMEKEWAKFYKFVRIVIFTVSVLYYTKNIIPHWTEKDEEIVLFRGCFTFDYNAKKRLFREEEKSVRIRDRCLVHRPRVPEYVSQAVRGLLQE